MKIIYFEQYGCPVVDVAMVHYENYSATTYIAIGLLSPRLSSAFASTSVPSSKMKRGVARVMLFAAPAESAGQAAIWGGIRRRGSG